MTTSEPSPAMLFEPEELPLMSSAAGSRARTFPSLESALASKVRDLVSGASMPGSLASYDPASSSWRTSQRCLVEGWEKFSETWPRSGMTRSGIAYQLPPLVPLTDATESGSWPTPTSTLGSNGGRVTPSKGREGGTLIEALSARLWPTPTVKGNYNRAGLSSKSGDGLATAVKKFPTPSANDWKGSSKAGQRRGQLTDPAMGAIPAGGALNPTWVEWLMGFPPNWTEVDMPKKNTLRKAARKATADVMACQACGAPGELERHHPDYSKPDLIEVLCPPCHIKADQRDGTRAKRATKLCAHCGREFLPTHSKKHALCSDECRVAVGRINAQKRWAKSGGSSPTSGE